MKVGDTVAWGAVPDGALVREQSDGPHPLDYNVKFNGRGWLVCPMVVGMWRGFSSSAGTPWHDVCGHSERVTIIATGLAGSETPADLQALAVAYESEQV